LALKAEMIGGASVDYERGFYRETASRPPLPGVEPLFPVSFSVIGEMSVSSALGVTALGIIYFSLM